MIWIPTATTVIWIIKRLKVVPRTGHGDGDFAFLFTLRRDNFTVRACRSILWFFEMGWAFEYNQVAAMLVQATWSMCFASVSNSLSIINNGLMWRFEKWIRIRCEILFNSSFCFSLCFSIQNFNFRCVFLPAVNIGENKKSTLLSRTMLNRWIQTEINRFKFD